MIEDILCRIFIHINFVHFNIYLPNGATSEKLIEVFMRIVFEHYYYYP